jgi:hypothetical protein
VLKREKLLAASRWLLAFGFWPLGIGFSEVLSVLVNAHSATESKLSNTLSLKLKK